MYTLIKESVLNEYEHTYELLDALYYCKISSHVPEITEYSCSIKFNCCAGKIIYVTGLTGLEVKYLSSQFS